MVFSWRQELLNPKPNNCLRSSGATDMIGTNHMAMMGKEPRHTHRSRKSWAVPWRWWRSCFTFNWLQNLLVVDESLIFQGHNGKQEIFIWIANEGWRFLQNLPKEVSCIHASRSFPTILDPRWEVRWNDLNRGYKKYVNVSSLYRWKWKLENQ